MKFVSTCFTFVLLACNASAAWTQWTVASGGNGHFYQAVAAPAGIGWLAAEAQAEAMGGTLATVTSAAENNFVFSLISSTPSYWFNFGLDTRGPWLGASQSPAGAEPNGGWSWVTGETFSFQNWAGGEPNDNLGDGNQDYLHYLGLGNNNIANTWNDMYPDAGGARAFVVEMVPEPGVASLFGIGFGALALRRRKTA